ncbi:metal ABC transporter permease [Saccharicrinis aurantiacus]|uniref:metal ABC transporter permease n=1 Tax=Saccharicrinis aurantiacus TaxID=1849719 RepID=UPI002492872F|nr:metal ABC transporter permease [Saccharicrinis aurantiacus]
MLEFFELFQYKFFTNALLAGLLTSILAGIIGTYIVSRRIVFISGGITHASFGGIGIAYFLGLNPFLGAAVFAVFSALGIEWSAQKAKVREDSAIAILWSLGMAIGIIFVFMTPGYTPNLMGFLFGNILTVTTTDIIVTAIFALIIIAANILFFRPILYTAFDENYASTTGLNVKLIKYSMAVAVALAIVLSIRIAGIILVLSLFTIPQAASMLITKDYKKIIFWSILFGFIGIIAGLSASYFMDIPSGATIIFALISIWIIIRAVIFIKDKLNLK